MPLKKRNALIEMADKYNFLIVEDNPYGYFRYDVAKIPTIKSCDKYQRVIYIGSFSKTLFPSLRLGYIVADQCIIYNNKRRKLVDEFEKTKSFITVNTSTILQSIVGNFLDRNNYSLFAYCQEKVKVYARNRDVMLKSLETSFPQSESWINNVHWSKPKGGFFIVLNVPFNISNALLMKCIKQYSIIFCPMSWFYLTKGLGMNQIRLSFSNLTTKNIKCGIEHLALFIKHKVAGIVG